LPNAGSGTPVAASSEISWWTPVTIRMRDKDSHHVVLDRVNSLRQTLLAVSMEIDRKTLHAGMLIRLA
jgi:hypothetical protein